MIFSALLIPVAVGLVILFLSGHKIRVYLLGASLGLLAGCIYILYQLVKELIALRKSNEGVILTPEYLESHTNTVGKEVGKILWSDIASVERKKFYGVLIHIKLKDPQKYVGKIKNKDLRKGFEGIHMDNSELEISFEELEKLIHEYFQKYGKNS
ncbi:STM3941 family protein [Capnocytophaga gingivalis]|uniref:STM3941 family protein n=1 Tax=Capnocytophaga gingivalis TaxID=1017 RepID=UPI0028D5F6D0|nr:STM3941 family protein [Capnocytophaga gingivalis]